MKYYPLNTRSGSTDIAETENISKALFVNVGYSFALLFHHSKISNSSFAFEVLKNNNGAFK